MKVLVLHVSGLHLGFLGCYGNTWITTPHLDRLAAESVVFDQHHVDCPGPRTAWTGRYEVRGGPAPGVPDLLRVQGVSVAHVAAEQLPAGADATGLENTLDAAVAALAVLGQSPWLCWVDLPSLQPPWEVPREFTARYFVPDEEDAEEEPEDELVEPLPAPAVGPIDRDDLILWERLRCTYAGAVTYLDAGLGLLFDELRRRDEFDDWWIIVTSDRGLALGEHGIVGDYRPWLHDEVVHVPLIVRQPGAADAGRRVSALTQPVDLVATLLDLFQVPLPQLDGRSCLPLLRGEVEKVREHSPSRWSLGEAEEWALRTPEAAFILPVKQRPAEPARPPQFYRKPEDRWEFNNVLQHHLEQADDYERILRALFGEPAT